MISNYSNIISYFKNPRFYSILASVFLSFSCANAFANSFWNVVSGNWNDPANWTGGVPTSTQTAFIANGGQANIGFGVNAVSNYLFVGNDDSGNLNSNGTLNISNGGAFDTGFISIGGEALGNVIVEGSGSHLLSNGQLSIGASSTGTGTLTASNNASVIVTSSGVTIGNGGSNGQLYLNSGAVLSTPEVAFGGVSVFNFDGGVLKRRFTSEVQHRAHGVIE